MSLCLRGRETEENNFQVDKTAHTEARKIKSMPGMYEKW